MAYIPSVVATNVNFPLKWLMMTNGAITSGVGLGMMAGGPCLEALIERYAWPGALLLSSAAALQGSVLWPLMAPPEGFSESGVPLESESWPLLG